MNVLSLQHVLLYGTLLSVALSIIILASLYINPRMWLQDFPKEIRAKLPPLSGAEKRQRMFLVVVILTTIIGVLLVSTVRLKAEQGGSITFLTAFLNTYLVFLVFNVFDAVVIDYLILTVIKPGFIKIPGTEGMEHLIYGLGYQVRAFLKGFIFCAVFSLPIAVLVML